MGGVEPIYVVSSREQLRSAFAAEAPMIIAEGEVAERLYWRIAWERRVVAFLVVGSVAAFALAAVAALIVGFKPLARSEIRHLDSVSAWIRAVDLLERVKWTPPGIALVIFALTVAVVAVIAVLRDYEEIDVSLHRVVLKRKRPATAALARQDAKSKDDAA
jgi:hypothetical protein